MRFRSSVPLLLLIATSIFQSCSDKILVPENATNPNRGKIVYFRFDTARFAAVLVDSDGSHPKDLLPNGIIWSSNGGRVIATAIDSNTPFGKVFTASNDLSNRVDVHYDTSQRLYGSLAISADGKHIAYSLVSKSSYDTARLYVADIDGANAKLVTDQLAHESDFSFSNSGDKLGYYIRDRVGPAVCILELNPWAVTTVARTTALLPDGYERISWSRDDAKISYIASPTYPSEVHIVNVDGDDDRKIGPGISAAWSPVADILALDDENGGLHTWSTDGLRDVYSSGVEGIRAWEWTLDGKTIVCESWSGDYDHTPVSLKLVDFESGRATTVATPANMPMVLK